MARPLRFQYPGAIYHAMARGDSGKFIFNDDVDAALFLKWLGEVCESHGWRVHAWVLIGNHFHLLLEPSSIAKRNFKNSKSIPFHQKDW